MNIIIASTADRVPAILSRTARGPDLVQEEASWIWQRITEPPIPFPQPQTNSGTWNLPSWKGFKAPSSTSLTPNQQNRARLLAVTRKESGAWLSTLPCAPLGHALDNTTLRITVGLRLGARLYHPHVCICGEPVDNLATHGLSCIKKGGTYSRHFRTERHYQTCMCQDPRPYPFGASQNVPS
jgi:hypothetical protein